MQVECSLLIKKLLNRFTGCPIYFSAGEPRMTICTLGFWPKIDHCSVLVTAWEELGLWDITQLSLFLEEVHLQ